MAFTAKDVAALREKTGCGMMDCKKALTASEGNMDAAIDFLREKGLAAATKKAGRIAAEGVAWALVNDAGNIGVDIEVNAETDFVAKNADFQHFVQVCADTVIESNPADVDALLQCKVSGTEQTIDALLKEKIQTIGENIKIRRFQRFEGVVAAYIHVKAPKVIQVRSEETLLPSIIPESVRELYGRAPKSKPIPISKVTPDIGSVTIWGEIFSVEQKITRDQQRKIITVNITDYSSSMTLKIIELVSQCKALDTLAKGMSIIARGDIEYDKYDHGFTVVPVSNSGIRARLLDTYKKSSAFTATVMTTRF